MKGVLLVLVGALLGAGGYWAWQRERGEPSLAEAIAAASAPFPAPSATGGDTPPASLPALVRAAPGPAARPAPPEDPPASPPPAPPAGLLIPVQGVAPAQLHDTFSDARSEGRVHDAIDILAPAGTAVLAVADGTVEKLFDSRRGGLTIYQFEPGGRYCYYYAHLQRYADGLAEKQAVRRGQVIGYVGSTGNASAGAPHLHFEVHRLGPERHWWQGEALNPYPLLHDRPPLP